MEDEYHEDNENTSGGAIATSGDISVSKKGIDGDKDNLLETNYTLFKRKNTSSDPESGNFTNDEGVYSQNHLNDNEGNYLYDAITNDRVESIVSLNAYFLLLKQYKIHYYRQFF